MKKTALVTGAGGFIGSHLVDHLLHKNYTVRACTWYHPSQPRGWLATYNPNQQTSLSIHPGDIRDAAFVESVLEGVHEVYHLAALISIPHSYQTPESYFQTNVMGTLNLLQACRKYTLSRIIIVSSSEVYGTAQFTPMTESHPLQAQSPYSASKIAKEKLAESFWHSYQLPLTVVRPFNTYGPRQSLRALIPSLILQLLNGKDQIFLGDLSPTRDWVYVTDTVEALIKIANSPSTLGKVLNIATGIESSVGEIASGLIKRINPEAKLIQDPHRFRPPSSEVYRLCGSYSYLNQLTGWSPNYDLQEGISQTITWYRKFQRHPSYQNLSYRI